MVERERVVEPEPAVRPQTSPPRRPLTASEASVIGLLGKRRRGLTLFGLRRR